MYFCGTIYLVHIWTAIFLEHLANTSFMASIQDWTETLVATFMSSLLVYFGPPSILLSVPTDHVSCSPFPASWQLNTNVQVNNMAALHHIYTGTHIYLHHIYITIHALLHTTSTPLGRPAGSDSDKNVHHKTIICKYLHIHVLKYEMTLQAL